MPLAAILAAKIVIPDDGKTHVRLDLENAPDIATELGHMCVAWAAVEYRVFAFFVAITGIPITLARATFYSHFNTRGRIDLLLSVAGMVLLKDGSRTPEFLELEDILKRVGKTAKRRNTYIHDPWAAWDKFPHEVFQMKLGGKGLQGEGTAIKKKDIAALITQIQALSGELFALYGRLLPLLPPFQKKLDKSRSLPLVFAREHIPPAIRQSKPRARRRSSRA